MTGDTSLEQLDIWEKGKTSAGILEEFLVDLSGGAEVKLETKVLGTDQPTFGNEQDVDELDHRLLLLRSEQRLVGEVLLEG